MTCPNSDQRSEAERLLRAALDKNDAEFYPGQWEAIERLVVHRERLLVVQRTGWGKSMVYFLATRLLRDRGRGPALLVSPLLALMRNQIQSALRIGIRACTTNSANASEWREIGALLESAGRHTPEGNSLLIEKGGIALNIEDLDERSRDLRAILEIRMNAARHSEVRLVALPFTDVTGKDNPVDVETSDRLRQNESLVPEPAMPAVGKESVFWEGTVWPLLHDLLIERLEVTKRDVATMLGVLPVQADAWLALAVEQGKVHKQLRPVRFTLAQERQMKLLP